MAKKEIKKIEESINVEEELTCETKEGLLEKTYCNISKLSKENLKKLSEVNFERISPDNLLKISQENISRISKEHKSRFERIEKFFYEKPLTKVPLFVGGLILLGIIVAFISKPGSVFFSFAEFIIGLCLTAYLTFLVVFFIKKSFMSLLTAKNLWALFGSYVMFVLCILFIFSTAYNMSEKIGWGYLTYGKCSDNFKTDMITQDNLKTENHFYFSAITLFTVGYGDVCPMGFNKNIAMLNAFVGNFINVVLMVIVISAYLKRKEDR